MAAGGIATSSFRTSPFLLSDRIISLEGQLEREVEKGEQERKQPGPKAPPKVKKLLTSHGPSG